MDQIPSREQTSGPIVHYVGMRQQAPATAVEVEFWGAGYGGDVRRPRQFPYIVIRETNLLNGVASVSEIVDSNELVKKAMVATAKDNRSGKRTEMQEFIEESSRNGSIPV